MNRNHWTGAGYDGAGNEVAIPNQTFTYDAENRLVATTQPNSPAISYACDGDGQRVQKTVGSSVTTYVYDAAEELVAEYGAATDTGTSYVSVDHLGSTRLLQQSSGAVRHYDYLPFGEDIPAGEFGRDSTYAAGAYPASGTDTLPVKFTGKERDSETGLDYFGARYFSAAQGRFTSPDPKVFPSHIDDPQSWNKYGYTRNNPLKYVDPNGEDWTLADLWEGAKTFVRSYFEPAIEASRNNGEPQPPTPSVPGIPTMHQMAKSEVETMAKGTNLIADAVSLIDPTGIGSATRSALSGDVKGTVMAMAVLGVPGGSEGKIALSEAKQLVGGWSAGTFEKIGASIAYHLEKHGAEVGAGSVWQYLRKAEGFAKNLKGAATTTLEDGATRYTKNGKYVILDESKKILSYGTVN